MISLSKMKSLIFIFVTWAGLGFMACKTTPTPSAPAPPKQEKQETPEARPAMPSESTDAVQTEGQEKSKPSQTATPEETAPQTQEPKKKSQASQTASPGAIETGPEKTDQNLSKRSPSRPQTSQAKLEKARDDLRVSQATEKRIAAELQQLKKSGNASAEDIRNYETYHERVRAMVAENRKIVEKMEAAHARHSPGKEASESTAAGEPKKRSDPTIPEEQTRDQVTELDRQLSASLNEFDAMLLKEMESIETESAAKMRDLAQEAAEAAKRLKEKGVDLGTAESESSDDRSEQSEQGEKGQPGEAGEKDASSKEKGTPAEQGDEDDAAVSSDRAKGEGQGPTGDRGSRYSKEDDDIVARQLREAAENETDPELKEKLWKEYEEYKKNTQQ
jgi:hypothetical protein